MEPNEVDAPEVLETQEPVVETVETPIDEEKEQLRKDKEELEKKNKQLFARLKKEGGEESNLSLKDQLALSQSGVSPDDLDEIVDFAKFKKISLTEALKSPTMKTILAEKAEERRTAAATQTKGARGVQKPSGEDLLAHAERTGEVPDTDEGMKDLFLARIQRKVRK